MPLFTNKVAEQDLREYFSKSGFYGRSMKFLQLDLAAVERPGWVQVFKFHVRAKKIEGEWEEIFGMVRTDERHDVFDVQLFETAEACQHTFEGATAGAINGVRQPRHWSYRPLMLLFLAALVVAVLTATLRLPR